MKWKLRILGALVFFSACVGRCTLDPVHAQAVCTAPPKYNVGAGLPLCSASITTGCRVPCSATSQELLGACDECLSWDPSPGAKWYVIQRLPISPSGTTWEVGATRTGIHGYIPAWTDVDGTLYEEVIPRVWCPAWDSPAPVAGRLYEYRVKACLADEEGDEVCGGYNISGVRYRAACHDCDGAAPTLCPGTEP